LPQTSKKLKSFLGIASFLRRYIKNYSSISQVLYEQSKGNKSYKLVWNKEMLEAYEKVKNAVKIAPSLGYVDLNSSEPVVLVTDASSKAIGYYLYQLQKSEKTGKLEKSYLFFGGLNLGKDAQKWPAWRTELYAVLRACKRLHNWLRPKKFLICVDNSACYYLLTKSLSKPPPYLARWLLQIQTLNYDVKHIPGTSNDIFLADFISRHNNIETDSESPVELDIDLLLANINVPPIHVKDMAEQFELNKIDINKLITSQGNDSYYSAMKKFLLF